MVSDENYIWIGTSLLIIAGLISLLDKLLKKATSQAEIPNLNREKNLAIGAFLVLLLGAYFTHITNQRNLIKSNTAERISDSTKALNDSLTRELAQLGKRQLDTAIEALTIERHVLHINNSIQEAQIELGKAQQESLNQITGGSNHPMLELIAKTSSYPWNHNNYEVELYLSNQSKYALNNVSIVTIDYYSIKDVFETVMARIPHDPALQIAATEPIPLYDSIVDSKTNHLSFAIMLPGQRFHICNTRSIDARKIDNSTSYEINVKWDRGSMGYSIPLRTEGNLLGVGKVWSIFNNSILGKGPEFFVFKNLQKSHSD